MARSFNLTAEINLRSPSNLKTVVAEIRRELGTVSADVNLKVDPKASRSIDSITKKLQAMNTVLLSSKNNTDSLNLSLQNLSSSLGGISSAGSKTAKAVSQTSASAQQAAKNIKAASSGMEEFGKQAFLAVKRFAAFSFATSGIVALTTAITSGFKAFIEYDRQLIRLQQVTGKSASELKGLENTIRDLAQNLGVSSEGLTQTAVTLAQAGLTANETRIALAALAKTELAPSFDDIAETAEGAIAAMRQFDIGAGDLEAALGSINAVAAAFAVEADDLIGAIQRTGGVFAASSKGVSEGTDALNEFLAIFTSVRQTTRESAETIATGLRTIFTRIQRARTIDQLREFGIELTDLDGKFVGTYEAVRRLSEGLSRLDPRDIRFSSIVEELGGFRQIGKVIPVIQQFAVAQEALKVAQKGQGSLTDAQVIAQKSLANQIAKVREQFLKLIADVGQSKAFQSLFQIVTSLASGLVSLAGAMKPILPILAIMGAVKGFKAIGDFGAGFFGAMGKGGARSTGENIGSAITGTKDKEKNDTVSKAADATRANTSALKTLTSAIDSLTTKLGAGGPSTLNSGGKVTAFARGGVVPGTGNRDTVPAMLMPGEFVIRKKAVETIGADNLHNMNKYGGGGSIKSGRANRRQKFAKGGAANLASIDGDFRAVDGDTFDAKVTPTTDQFIARFRVAQFDTYETRGDSLVSEGRGSQIMSLNPRRKPLKEVNGRYKVPKDYTVTEQEGYTAQEAAYAAKDELDSQISSFIGTEAAKKTSPGGGVGRYLAKTDFIMPENLTTGRKWDEDGNELNLGGIVQKFAVGGKVLRNLGYIDYDVIANEANKNIVENGMKSVGITGPRLYAEYLTDLAVQARKNKSLDKLRAIYGVAGSGKTTIARGQGTDNANLRQTNRFPILTPDDIDIANEILVLSSSVSRDKLDSLFSNTDRTYTISSSTKAERERVRSQRATRDITGIGLEGRQPGTTSSASADTAVGEALLADKLGDRSVVLGRSGSGRLRQKRGNELVDIVRKKIAFTWGGFAPTTAGHESIIDAAAAMGFAPEDFIALVGANEGIKAGDPSSYRTAVFDQDFRVLLARAGFGARGATVLPKPRDFEVPQAFDITQEGSDRRQVLIPKKGSRAFVADKTPDQMSKYKEAGYAVTNLERTGGISGTMVRDLVMSGDMAKLQDVLSPGVYDLISANIGRLRNRANVLPSIIEQVRANQGASLEAIDKEIAAVGIKRIDSKKAESDPEYAAKVQLLEELRNKKKKLQSAASFEPYRLLSELARSQPDKYGLDTNVGRTSKAPSLSTMAGVKKAETVQAKDLAGLIKQFAEAGEAETSGKPLSRAEILRVLGVDGAAKAAGISSASVYSLLGLRNPDSSQIALREAIEREYVKKVNRVAGRAKGTTTNLQNRGLEFAAAGLFGKPFEPQNIDIQSDRLSRSAKVRVISGVMKKEAADKMQSIFEAGSQELSQKAADVIRAEYGESGPATGQTILNPNAEASIQGGLLEKAIQMLGGPGKVKGQGFDFPEGLKGAAKYFGLPEDVPTDVKRTLEGPSTFTDNIVTYLKNVMGYKLGGRVYDPQNRKRFAIGGLAEATGEMTNLMNGLYANGSQQKTEAKKQKNFGQIALRIGDRIQATYMKQGMDILTKGLEMRSGQVIADKINSNLYAVQSSAATKGYGPKLYDVVMEAATEQGAMLTSDRRTVSADAKRVWEYYFNNRSDVNKTPLDPADWTSNSRLVDPKLYGKPETWPPFNDPAWILQTGYSKAPSDINNMDLVQRLASGGPVDVYHGSNTGPNNEILESFKTKGVQASIAQGYGQGSGFYVWSDKDTAFKHAKSRIAGDITTTGETGGRPMVVQLTEILDPSTWDLDYETNKNNIISWLYNNFDKIKDNIMPDRSQNVPGIKRSLKMGEDIGLQLQNSEGRMKSIYASGESDLASGEYIGQIISRLQSQDPALVQNFEKEFFDNMGPGIGIKYVGNTPLNPSDIKTFANGGSTQDTVPALLTPGEFVINKNAAKKIGYGKLERLNKADKIQGYNKGGYVGFQRLFRGGVAETQTDRARGSRLKDVAEAESVFTGILSELGPEIQAAIMKGFTGIENIQSGETSKFGGNTISENTRGLAMFKGKQSAMAFQIGGKKTAATTETVAHETGHLADMALGGGKDYASSMEGTFQFEVVNKVKEQMVSAFEKAGYSSEQIAKYLTNNQELFAEFFAKASPEIRAILTSTTDAQAGMKALADHLGDVGFTYAGLQAADIDQSRPKPQPKPSLGSRIVGGVGSALSAAGSTMASFFRPNKATPPSAPVPSSPPTKPPSYIPLPIVETPTGPTSAPSPAPSPGPGPSPAPLPTPSPPTSPTPSPAPMPAPVPAPPPAPLPAPSPPTSPTPPTPPSGPTPPTPPKGGPTSGVSNDTAVRYMELKAKKLGMSVEELSKTLVDAAKRTAKQIQERVEAAKTELSVNAVTAAIDWKTTEVMPDGLAKDRQQESIINSLGDQLKSIDSTITDTEAKSLGKIIAQQMAAGIDFDSIVKSNDRLAAIINNPLSEEKARTMGLAEEADRLGVDRRVAEQTLGDRARSESDTAFNKFVDYLGGPLKATTRSLLVASSIFEYGAKLFTKGTETYTGTALAATAAAFRGGAEGAAVVAELDLKKQANSAGQFLETFGGNIGKAGGLLQKFAGPLQAGAIAFAAVSGALKGLANSIAQSRLESSLNKLSIASEATSEAFKRFDKNPTDVNATLAKEAMRQETMAAESLRTQGQVDLQGRTTLDWLRDWDPTGISQIGQGQQQEARKAYLDLQARQFEQSGKIGERRLETVDPKDIEESVNQANESQAVIDRLTRELDDLNAAPVKDEKAIENKSAEIYAAQQAKADKLYTKSQRFGTIASEQGETEALRQFYLSSASSEEDRVKKLDALNGRLGNSDKERTDNQRKAFETAKRLAAQEAETESRTRLLADATQKLSLQTENLVRTYAVASAMLQRFGDSINTIKENANFRAKAIEGQAQIGSIDRTNEKILGNIDAYSIDEVRGAAVETGQLAGGGLTGQTLQNQVLTAKVLQESLPSALATTNSENVGEVIDKLETAFQTAGVEFSAPIKEELRNSLNKEVSGRDGVSFQKLANESDVVANLLKQTEAGLRAAQDFQKQYNDALAGAIELQNSYAQALSQSIDYQIKSAQIQADAAITLKETLGQTVTTEERNAAVDMEVRALTSTNIIPGGTTDPEKIFQQLMSGVAAQEDQKAELARRQQAFGTSPTDENKARVAEQLQTMAQQNVAVNNSRKALEMLANDGRKAANALKDLQELDRVATGATNFTRTVLTAAPEEQAKIAKQLQAFTKFNTGQATAEDLNDLEFRQNVFGGGDLIKSVLPKELADQLDAQTSLDMLRNMPGSDQILKKVVGRVGDQEITLESALQSKASGIDPAQERFIKAYNDAIKIQSDAAALLGKSAEAVAQTFNSEMINVLNQLQQQLPIILERAVSAGMKPQEGAAFRDVNNAVKEKQNLDRNQAINMGLNDTQFSAVNTAYDAVETSKKRTSDLLLSQAKTQGFSTVEDFERLAPDKFKTFKASSQYTRSIDAQNSAKADFDAIVTKTGLDPTKTRDTISRYRTSAEYKQAEQNIQDKQEVFDTVRAGPQPDKPPQKNKQEQKAADDAIRKQREENSRAENSGYLTQNTGFMATSALAAAGASYGAVRLKDRFFGNKTSTDPKSSGGPSGGIKNMSIEDIARYREIRKQNPGMSAQDAKRVLDSERTQRSSVSSAADMVDSKDVRSAADAAPSGKQGRSWWKTITETGASLLPKKYRRAAGAVAATTAAVGGAAYLGSRGVNEETPQTAGAMPGASAENTLALAQAMISIQNAIINVNAASFGGGFGGPVGGAVGATQASLQAVSPQIIPSQLSEISPSSIAPIKEELASAKAISETTTSTATPTKTKKKKEKRSGWLDLVQGGLDIAGLVPLIGELADLANAGIYTARAAASSDADVRNDLMIDAGLSTVSAIPIAGYAGTAAKGARYAMKGVKAASSATKNTSKAVKYAKTGAEFVGNAAVNYGANKVADGLRPDEKPEENPLSAAVQQQSMVPTQFVSGGMIPQMNFGNMPGFSMTNLDTTNQILVDILNSLQQYLSGNEVLGTPTDITPSSVDASPTNALSINAISDSILSNANGNFSDNKFVQSLFDQLDSQIAQFSDEIRREAEARLSLGVLDKTSAGQDLLSKNIGGATLRQNLQTAAPIPAPPPPGTSTTLQQAITGSKSLVSETQIPPVIKDAIAAKQQNRLIGASLPSSLLKQTALEPRPDLALKQAKVKSAADDIAQPQVATEQVKLDDSEQKVIDASKKEKQAKVDKLKKQVIMAEKNLARNKAAGATGEKSQAILDSKLSELAAAEKDLDMAYEGENLALEEARKAKQSQANLAGKQVQYAVEKVSRPQTSSQVQEEQTKQLTPYEAQQKARREAYEADKKARRDAYSASTKPFKDNQEQSLQLTKEKNKAIADKRIAARQEEMAKNQDKLFAPIIEDNKPGALDALFGAEENTSDPETERLYAEAAKAVEKNLAEAAAQRVIEASQITSAQPSSPTNMPIVQTTGPIPAPLPPTQTQQYTAQTVAADQGASTSGASPFVLSLDPATITAFTEIKQSFESFGGYVRQLQDAANKLAQAKIEISGNTKHSVDIQISGAAALEMLDKRVKELGESLVVSRIDEIERKLNKVLPEHFKPSGTGGQSTNTSNGSANR